MNREAFMLFVSELRSRASGLVGAKEMAFNAQDFDDAFQTDNKFADSDKDSACNQMESQQNFVSSQKMMVDSKACVLGKEDNKYICETHGKRFISRQYMNVHLTNYGMEPLPKLKRGRKSLGAANLSSKDLTVGAVENQSHEKKPDVQKKKRLHNRVKMIDSGQEAFSTSKRGKKVHSTMSISRGTTEQNCVVEQYDDGYVCETHGLKYRSRHTINVHLINCGMEPLPKLKRGRKSSSTPLESKRRRYEPSRSQETVIATGTDTNEKSCSRSSPGTTYYISPPERLDRGVEEVSGHLKVGIFICDREVSECKNSFSEHSAEKLIIQDCSYRWFDEFSISSHVHLPKAQSYSSQTRSENQEQRGFLHVNNDMGWFSSNIVGPLNNHTE